jgi:hypothetical protein
MNSWVCATTIVAIPICYVGSLYLFDRQRLHSDHPSTIKKRILGVSLASGTILLWTYFLLKRVHNDPLYLMGIFIDSKALTNTIKAIGLSSTVYLGTFIMNYFDRTLQSNSSKFF